MPGNATTWASSRFARSAPISMRVMRPATIDRRTFRAQPSGNNAYSNQRCWSVSFTGKISFARLKPIYVEMVAVDALRGYHAFRERRIVKPDWLEIRRGKAPLVVSFPHTGTGIPAEFEGQYVSKWQGQKDANWWVDRLYDFAPRLDATTVRTRISRSVIDVNRDPSGASLYPGQATTELCPTTTFDGDPLYRDRQEPDGAEIARRREHFFQPYHDALRTEIGNLGRTHPNVVLFEAHSIRSRIP